MCVSTDRKPRLNTNNQDQMIAAISLRHALEYLKSNDIENARYEVSKAKELLPNYIETYRISALIESNIENYYQAREEYERALQFEPTSPIVNYAYAQFLNKYLEDFDTALEKVEVALTGDKDSQTLLSFKALLLTRLGLFGEAINIYENILKNTDSIPKKWLKSIRDQTAETYRRWCQRNRKLLEYDACKDNLTCAFKILEFCFIENSFDNGVVSRYLKTMFNKATEKEDYKNIPELSGASIGNQARGKGTVQAASWEFSQFNSNSVLRKNRLFVVVTRNDFPWGENHCDIEEPYALVACLRDRYNGTIKLYTQIRNQLKAAVRQRVKI